MKTTQCCDLKSINIFEILIFQKKSPKVFFLVEHINAIEKKKLLELT